MKLIEVDFCLEWPISIEVFNLRKYIMENLMRKGEVIRWSIVDIKIPLNDCDTKKLTIHAVLVN